MATITKLGTNAGEDAQKALDSARAFLLEMEPDVEIAVSALQAATDDAQRETWENTLSFLYDAASVRALEAEEGFIYDRNREIAAAAITAVRVAVIAAA